MPVEACAVVECVLNYLGSDLNAAISSLLRMRDEGDQGALEKLNRRTASLLGGMLMDR